MSVRPAHALRTDLGEGLNQEELYVITLSIEPSAPNELVSSPVDSPANAHWKSEFAATVEPLRNRLHRLAMRILQSDDLAEDAVQEALTSLWREERLPPNPTGWLYRAVINRSLHLNRCRRRRRSHEERACLHRTEFQLGGEASRALENEELAQLIKVAIAELPEPYREVFFLREVELLEYEAIAAKLRLPVGTVRSRLSRARQWFRKSIEQILPDECAVCLKRAEDRA